MAIPHGSQRECRRSLRARRSDARRRIRIGSRLRPGRRTARLRPGRPRSRWIPDPTYATIAVARGCAQRRNRHPTKGASDHRHP
jgi:hypothetical protein